MWSHDVRGLARKSASARDARDLGARREIDRRARSIRDFEPLFEHFAANLAFWGALIFTTDRDTRWFGLAIALVLAIPITGALKIIFDHVESMKAFAAWLGE